MLAAVPARAGQPQARLIASVSQGAVWHCYIPTGSYARTVSIAIGRSASNYIMKRRTNHDKHRRVAQESARNGSLRAGWCREPAGSASASALGGQNLTNEEVARKWYAAWEKKDWGPVDSLFADNFTLYKRGRRRPHQQEHFQSAMLGNTDRFHWTF